MSLWVLSIEPILINDMLLRTFPVLFFVLNLRFFKRTKQSYNTICLNFLRLLYVIYLHTRVRYFSFSVYISFLRLYPPLKLCCNSIATSQHRKNKITEDDAVVFMYTDSCIQVVSQRLKLQQKSFETQFNLETQHLNNNYYNTTTATPPQQTFSSTRLGPQSILRIIASRVTILGNWFTTMMIKL